MANRIESFKVTIPAGTFPSNATLTPLTFDEGDVETIEVVIPDGPAGLSGFQIAKGGQQIIPATQGAWIISNNENIRWDLTQMPEGTQWELIGYNTDIYDHSYYLRVLVSDYHVRASIPDTGLALSIPAVTVTP